MRIKNQFEDIIEEKQSNLGSPFITHIQDHEDRYFPTLNKAKKYIKTFHKNDRLSWKTMENSIPKVSTSSLEVNNEIMLALKFKKKEGTLYEWNYDNDFPTFTVDISKQKFLHQVFEACMWEIWDNSRELGRKELAHDFCELMYLDK